MKNDQMFPEACIEFNEAREGPMPDPEVKPALEDLNRAFNYCFPALRDVTDFPFGNIIMRQRLRNSHLGHRVLVTFFMRRLESPGLPSFPRNFTDKLRQITPHTRTGRHDT